MLDFSWNLGNIALVQAKIDAGLLSSLKARTGAMLNLRWKFMKLRRCCKNRNLKSRWTEHWKSCENFEIPNRLNKSYNQSIIISFLPPHKYYPHWRIIPAVKLVRENPGKQNLYWFCFMSNFWIDFTKIGPGAVLKPALLLNPRYSIACIEYVSKTIEPVLKPSPRLT